MKIKSCNVRAAGKMFAVNHSTLNDVDSVEMVYAGIDLTCDYEALSVIMKHISFLIEQEDHRKIIHDEISKDNEETL